MCRLPCISVCCTGVGLAPCAQCVAGLLAGEGVGGSGTCGRLWIGGMCEVQDGACSECECSHVGDKKVEVAELGLLS